MRGRFGTSGQDLEALLGRPATDALEIMERSVRAFAQGIPWSKRLAERDWISERLTSWPLGDPHRSTVKIGITALERNELP